MKKRILVSAGDPSGDLLLSKVIEELLVKAKQNGLELEFVGLAGDRCEAAGVKLLARSEDVAVVGIAEVLGKLRTIFGVLSRLSAELESCDSVICVDFPDFNFKLAEAAAKKNKPVDYLVAPQMWAWRGNRIDRFKRLVRRAYPVLPFEESFLRQSGVDARYLGHPLRDVLPPRNRRAAREELGIKEEDFLFAILPGSRRSEIKRHLSILVRAWAIFQKEAEHRHLPQRFRAQIPLAKGFDLDSLRAMLSGRDLQLFESFLASQEWRINRDSWLTMQAADFGWVASGTATLEAAYYQLPHLLFYRLSWISARMIDTVTPYFSNEGGMAGLPNILLEKRVIPELLQNDLTPDRLSLESHELLGNAIRMTSMKRNLRWIPKKLGEAHVSSRLAEDLWTLWGF
ncbi:MAG: lipid-A-disaccharide synthase [Bdellovibrionota bacterium]